MRPLHHVEELVVTLAHHRAERLLADDLGQQRQVRGLVALREAEAGQRRAIRRIGVAAAGQERVLDLVDVLDLDRRKLDVVHPEIVVDRKLGAGPRLHAHRGAVQLLHRLHVRRRLHQEAGAVVVVHVGELEAEAAFAAQRPGRLADQHVDLARLQRGEPVDRGRRREAHLVAVPQDRGGHRTAIVGVDALDHALAVRQREPGNARRHAAYELPACLDRVDRGRTRALCMRARNTGADSKRECARDLQSIHSVSPIIADQSCMPRVIAAIQMRVNPRSLPRDCCPGAIRRPICVGCCT